MEEVLFLGSGAEVFLLPALGEVYSPFPASRSHPQLLSIFPFPLTRTRLPVLETFVTISRTFPDSLGWLPSQGPFYQAGAPIHRFQGQGCGCSWDAPQWSARFLRETPKAAMWCSGTRSPLATPAAATLVGFFKHLLTYRRKFKWPVSFEVCWTVSASTPGSPRAS